MTVKQRLHRSLSITVKSEELAELMLDKIMPYIKHPYIDFDKDSSFYSNDQYMLLILIMSNFANLDKALTKDYSEDYIESFHKIYNNTQTHTE